MKCTVLRQRLELIRVFAGYDSMSDLARSIDFPLTTIRSWWKDNGDGVNVIPEHNEERVFTFVSELLPGRPSPEFVKQLFHAPLIYLHNALQPAGGRLLSQLLDERLSGPPLELSSFASLPRSIERDTEGPIEADSLVLRGQPFEFALNIPWSGECALLREFEGEWRVMRLIDNLSSVQRPLGRVVLPGKDLLGVQRYLRVREWPGVYRYYALCLHGIFDESLRHHFLGPQPLDRYALDAIASAFLLAPERKTRVFTTSVEATRTEWDGR